MIFIYKLKTLAGLSEYKRNVVEILLDSTIEKDKLEKLQTVTMKRRLEWLSKVRGK